MQEYKVTSKERHQKEDFRIIPLGETSVSIKKMLEKYRI